MDYRIRKAETGDMAAIAELYAYHVRTGTGTFETEAPDTAEMAARLQALVARGLPVLLAETQVTPGAGSTASPTLLGYAYAGPFRTRAAYRYTVEDSVYLAPLAQRRGIGSTLLAEVIVDCTALGYRQMLALIGDSRNAGSIALHTRLGFCEAGVLRAVGYKHEGWLDVVLMQRALEPAADAGEPPPW